MERAQLEKILTQSGIVNSKQIEKALDYCESYSTSLEDSLIELGYVDATIIGKVLASLYKMPYVPLKTLKAEYLPLKTFSPREVQRYEVIPVAYKQDKNMLTLATYDPEDKELFKAIKKNFPSGTEIKLVVASRKEILGAMRRFYSVSPIPRRAAKEVPKRKEVSPKKERSSEMQKEQMQTPPPTALKAEASESPLQEVIDIEEDEPDAEIKITLPEDFKIVEEKDTEVSDLTLEYLKQINRKSNVLIIEPNHKLRNPLRSLLEAYHYNVDATVDDSSALVMIEQTLYDYVIRRRATRSRTHILERQLQENRKDTKICFFDDLDRQIVGATVPYEKMSEGYLSTIIHLVKLILTAERDLFKKIETMARYGKMLGMRMNMDKTGIDALVVATYLSSLGQSQTLTKILITEGKRNFDKQEPQRIAANLCLTLKAPYPVYDILSEWANSSEGKNVSLLEARILYMLDFFLETFQFHSSDELKQAIEDIKTALRSQFSEDGKLSEVFIKILADEAYIGDFELIQSTILFIDKTMSSDSDLFIRLQNDGYTLQVATGAPEAMEAISNSLPDLIISETKLEGTDGFELCRLLKSNDRTRHIPFIFVTEVHDPVFATEGIRSGAEDYITKPYSAEMVALKISRILERFEKIKTGREPAKASVYGRLEEMSFVDIIQILSGSSKTASIILNHNSKEGQVFLEDGCIIDAAVDNLSGEQAVYALMSWKKGEFRIEALRQKVNRAIFESTENILLEGCRIMDEAGQSI